MRGTRGRARGSRGMDVWQLANALQNCPHTKNAVPNLPPENEVTEAEAKQYIGRLCLLTYNEAASPSGKQNFHKRSCLHACYATHLFAFFCYLYFVVFFACCYRLLFVVCLPFFSLPPAPT